LDGLQTLRGWQLATISHSRRWPSVGDAVHTFGAYWPPTLGAVTIGIQLSQKLGTWDGVPQIPAPYWRLTHSMAYVGVVSKVYVDEYERRGDFTAEEAALLLSCNDWMLSMTHPVCVWVRYAAVKNTHHVISRPRFCDFRADWQVRAWQHALWWWLARRYDTAQLFGILHDLLGEEHPREYSRAFDAAPWRTVCSGAVASAYEAVRRQAILRAHAPSDTPEWITCDDATEWANEGGIAHTPHGVNAWWSRILNGLHLERVAPGHLCLGAWFGVREVSTS
jgi:hypothetical protein